MKLKCAKFWILLVSQIRLDMKAHFHFWGSYLWIFLLCLIYRFLLQTALSRPTIPLGGYQISFPLFLVSGIALFRLVLFSVSNVDDAISHLRRSGVIDWILITPTSIHELLFVRSVWGSFLGITQLATAVIFGNLLIGTPIRPFLQGSSFCALFLMSFAYIGLGMGIAAVSILLRRGSFLCSIVQQISSVFGGVFFPTHLLPKGISFIPQALPITHALNIARYAMTHAGQPVILSSFLPLLEMALVYFVLGFFILQKSLHYARQNGLLLKDLHE